MTAGELLLVVGAVLCALAFAALAVTLVRVRDTLGALRAEVAELRAETTPLLAELRTSTDDARAAMATARADLDRFDGCSARPRRSARRRRHVEPRRPHDAVGADDQGRRARHGTSRAVRRLRRGA